MIFRDTVTLYNIIPQQGREPERLRHSVLPGVFWDGSSGAAYSKTGAAPQDSTVVYIPYRRQYMLPARWADAGYPQDSFTLRAGDILVRGAVGDENPTAAGLLQKYGSECCIIINTVRNCCYGSKAMWHWEVSGR